MLTGMISLFGLERAGNVTSRVQRALPLDL